MKVPDEGGMRPLRPGSDGRLRSALFVMTFNLRFENQRDGANAWENRRSEVAGLIERHRPDLLGTQEGLPSQLRYLEKNLSEYRLHAPDRFWDDTCQYPSLFYRLDAFELAAGGEFWLSTTPGVHRSKDWDSAFPRMMSWARLKMRGNGRLLTAAVTHLDHIGTEARIRQAGIIAQWVTGQMPPVVLLGDFNDAPGSDVHRILTAPATGLNDTWEDLGLAGGERSFTHHGFTGIPQVARIDWILAGDPLRASRARILRDRSDNGLYPSDHFPYCVELVWDEGREGLQREEGRSGGRAV